MKNLLILALAFAIAGCNNQNTETPITKNPVYDWTDSSVRANADFFYEYQQGYDQEIHVDPQLAEWLVMDVVNNENATFFDYDYKPLGREEVNDILRKVRTMMVEDPDNPGTIVEIIDTVTIGANDIIQVLTKEEWSMDKNSLSFHKKVNMMAPVIITLDEEGNPRGKDILYWIKMN